MKYILITASSRGLGLEIAKQLSFEGYNIILTSSNNKNLEIAKNTLNPKLEHISIKIDFKQDNVNEILVNKIKDLNLVAIIHNYGVKIKNDTHPISENILNQTIYNNFTLSLKINNLLYKKLNENLSKIIYIGSTASLHTKASPSYTLSKSLINTYVKNASQFYLENNISICAILPGIMDHKGSDWDKKKIANYDDYITTKNNQPLKRFTHPQEIASYIVCLVKIDNFLVTGTIIKLDVNAY